MDDALKSRLIVILAVLTLIFFVTSVGSCRKASSHLRKFQLEMGKRLDAEEKMSISTREKDACDKAIAALNEEIAKEKKAHEATGKALLQEQLVSESLTGEMLKLKKANEQLEADLKAAIASAKEVQAKK